MFELKTTPIAAALLLIAHLSANAALVISHGGKTFDENFNEAMSFTSLVNAQLNPGSGIHRGDDYLYMAPGLRYTFASAQLNFTTLQSGNLTLDFWYGFYAHDPRKASVSLDGIAIDLPATTTPANSSGFVTMNPGPSGGSTNRFFTHKFANLTAGNHVLEVKTFNGDSTMFKLDDLHMTLAVPEPETYGLMLAGLAVLGFVSRRRAVS